MMPFPIIIESDIFFPNVLLNKEEEATEKKIRSNKILFNLIIAIE